VKLFSKNSIPTYVTTIHQRYTQTDERTDRQTTCHGNTALCAASRGKKTADFYKARTRLSKAKGTAVGFEAKVKEIRNTQVITHWIPTGASIPIYQWRQMRHSIFFGGSIKSLILSFDIKQYEFCAQI